MMIYTALVLAYPLGWKNKLIGLAFGIAAIFVTNLIRLVAVAQRRARSTSERSCSCTTTCSRSS